MDGLRPAVAETDSHSGRRLGARRPTRPSVILLAGVAAALGCERPTTLRVTAGGVDSAQMAAASLRHPALPDSAERARQDSIDRARPDYVVDSVLPVDEEIRRFRASLPNRPTELAHAAPALDALVRRFADAVSRNDTTALVRLMVTRSEFGHLVYPSSPYTREPYRLPPDVLWLQLRAASNKGADRVLARLGGRAVEAVGHECAGAIERQGENVIHTGCVVHLNQGGGAPLARKLFGPVLERRGRFKLLSLANDL